VRYLDAVGMQNVAAHEQQVTAYALGRLGEIGGVRLLGPTEMVERGGAVSFVVDGVHPHDVSQVLDSRGIAVRAGHHCAKPAHARFGAQSSVRASGYLYTTESEIDQMVDAVRYAQRYFGVA
jgi:cysteine desulfurase/selenocysteine lyase